jgi:hypothetical protein
MLPGLADMRGNAMKQGRSIVFSTGQQFPRFSVLGRVFDWAAERPAPNAFVEAMSLPDSTRFVGVSDSLGAFDVGPLGEGTYVVRALIDQNDNRAVDRSEKWDTTRVTVSGVRTPIEMRAIERDSEPPVIFDITAPDTLSLQIAFDKPIDPNQPLTPALIRVQRADSSELQQLQVMSMAAAERQRADSIRRADSVRAASQPPGQRPPTGIVPGAPPGARPSVGPPPPKPSIPPPSKGILVRLSPSTPLRPGDTYRITARNVRNLLGNTREVSRTFTMPRAATPPDSARRPPADSVVRRPPLGNRRGLE